MKPEVCHGETEVQSEFKLEAVKLVKERGCDRWRRLAGPGRAPDVLRKWVREFGCDPEQAFPGHGQMKPEQAEIAG